jgi:hypothetical protein
MQKVIDALILIPYIFYSVVFFYDLHATLNLPKPEKELTPLLGVVTPQEEKTPNK